MTDLLGWPGKSAHIPDGAEHPAVFHMLDVAAVAEILIAPFSFPPPLRDALVLLTALHDLGKINADFRQMLRTGTSQVARHWQVTELLLRHHDRLLEARLGNDPLLRPWLYSATAGHHGRPPDLDIRSAKYVMIRVGPEAIADAGAVIAEFLDLWPDASLSGLEAGRMRDLSWWLPGLVSAADWVGSNPIWFPAEPDPRPLRAYLDHARQKARQAVLAAGIGGAALCEGAPLFDFALRPMQRACTEIDLPPGPMLAVIEDETGAGKTEAALILAQRMLRAGKARGLYLALPTMATSDAMFARAKCVVGRLFDHPSLTLAHGRAAQSEQFRDLVTGTPNAPEDVGCTDWLADNRRRALLADVGVGTIDQALLAALPTKFHTLRHFALSSKILVVDEVHELGEPYIVEVLARLLQFHRQAGGSAILVTATLPLPLRRKLMAIYGTTDDDPAYPALSISGGPARRDMPQETGVRGPVAVRRLPDADAAVDLLVQAVRQGAACVWVRNAVDDAIAAVQALRAKGVKADLLHARFALADRKRIETAALARFGKTGDDRQGRVLVGTQVLESSLDLDFDVMVSDLAPMAALIQRAGRLWRHMDLRPRAGRPVSVPELHTPSPHPPVVTDARWLQQVLDRGAFVYPTALQWRTAAHLFRVGQIVAPSGLRGLIEPVHGPDAAPVPAPLERDEIKVEGSDRARAAHAWLNVISLDDDFRTGSKGVDDAEYPTRLGEPTQVLALATLHGDTLVPWGEDWAMAEVSVAQKRLAGLVLPDQAQPGSQAVTRDWPEWKQKTVTVCPVAEDGRICEGLSYDADLGLIFG